VLLDRSFLHAVADTADPKHDDAVATYRALIDDFVAGRCLLLARHDHLRELARPDLFAAIDKLHVARQHRNAAATVADRTGIAMDEAITLVLIRRYKIRRVMTFADYSVELPAQIAMDTLAAEGA
jgi:predicted nucleic acid-binding protein